MIAESRSPESFIGTEVQLAGYACPLCLGSLAPSTSDVTCVDCRTVFPFVDGVPVFAEKPDSSLGTLAPSELDRLLSLCRNLGWTKGVANFLQGRSGPDGDFWARYFTPESRAAGRLLLPADPQAKVLDLGCGVGPLSINFARYTHEVVAADRGLNQLQLLKLRAEESGIHNLHLVCAGDRKHLPFASETFDVVLLNGVLEWVASSLNGNPRDRQRSFLTEVNRILKPRGEIYIGIENRFGLNYLLGGPDEHTRLRFVTLLPRKIADLFSRLKKGKPYRIYTYTRRGYRKLLGEAGFKATRFYLPRPNYRRISQIVGDNKAVFSDSLSEKPSLRGMRHRPLRKLAYPYLTHSYSIVAAKSQWAPSLIEESISRLDAWLSSRGRVKPDHRPVLVRIGDTSVALISVSEPRGGGGFMLRIPLTPQVSVQQRHNLETLTKIVAKLGPDSFLAGLLPQPLATLECKGNPVFVERLCPGFDLRNCYRRQDLSGVFRLGLDFLLKLHREFDESRTHSSASIDSWLRVREHHIYKNLPSFPEGSLESLVEDAKKCLHGCRLPMVCTHGDFWPGNLLTTERGDSLTGVVDWEFSDLEGIPLLDLMHLLLYTKGLLSGKGFTRSLAERFSAHRFESDEIPFVKEYCAELGIPGSAVWPLVFMAWLDWVYRRSGIHGFLPSWRHNEVEGFLEAARKHTHISC